MYVYYSISKRIIKKCVEKLLNVCRSNASIHIITFITYRRVKKNIMITITKKNRS